MVAVVLALVFVIMVELAKLSCIHQFQMNLEKVGWNVKMWVCQE